MFPIRRTKVTMIQYNIYRILDANINRCCEGLRVIEDTVRFQKGPNMFRKAYLVEKDIREIRHEIRNLFMNLEEKFIANRDIQNDIGLKISQEQDKKPKYNHDIISANFKRVEESLRVIEENCKNINLLEKSRICEAVRFKVYSIHKIFYESIKKQIPEGLYGITASNFSRGRNTVDIVKEMCENNIKIIQYREKYKSKREKYQEATELKKICDNFGALLIVNDDIDIAILIDADGIHIGQEDLQIEKARQLVGENKIIGISTHSTIQAEEALKYNADYIGVGPIFRTMTKENVCEPVTLSYLDYCSNNITIPQVAIGGIKEDNLRFVLDKGAKRVALVTEITNAENITFKIKKLMSILKEYGIEE